MSEEVARVLICASIYRTPRAGRRGVAYRRAKRAGEGNIRRSRMRPKSWRRNTSGGPIPFRAEDLVPDTFVEIVGDTRLPGGAVVGLLAAGAFDFLIAALGRLLRVLGPFGSLVLALGRFFVVVRPLGRCSDVLLDTCRESLSSPT